MEIEPEDIRLLRNARFRRLLEARVLGQTAQNAMLYALLILVVRDTGSSLKSTFLIVAFTLPPIILGIPAGAIADLLPRRLTLTLGYLLRGAIVTALIFYSHDLVYIYLLAAASSVVGLFFSPAEAAVVPAVVRRDQLPAANSLMVLSLILGQIAGMVVLAPLLIKLVDPRAVFVAGAGLFLAAAYVMGWMTGGFTRAEDEKPPSIGFVEAMREGFQILRTNRHAYLAIMYLTMALALSRVLVILLPQYTEDVLHIRPEDTVFVAAPAAIGAGLGLLLAPPATRFLGAWRVVAGGLVLFLLGLAALGLVIYVRDFIEAHLNLGISFVEREVGVSSVITVTMLLAAPLGFAFTLVNVASRVVMNEQAPQEAQGRVFAMQMALGDFVSLLPLLIVGVVADVVGARATLLAAAVGVTAVAGWLTFSRRFGPPDGAAPEPVPRLGTGEPG
ncbi:MAG: MFS transporter [Dehalococcoidia bacterium]|nr:MFS transporter [Dehalococcoidia bacterium]